MLAGSSVALQVLSLLSVRASLGWKLARKACGCLRQNTMIKSVSYDVEFTVRMPYELCEGERVFVTGNVPALGNWMLDLAIPLEPVKQIVDGKPDSSLWSRVVTLTNHFRREVYYRFFVGQRLSPPASLESSLPNGLLIVRSWETFRSPRLVDLFDVSSLEIITDVNQCHDLPNNEDSSDIQNIADSAACYGLADDGTESVHHGWLVGQAEIHLRFHSSPVKLWKVKDQELSCRIHVTPMLLDDEDVVSTPSSSKEQSRSPAVPHTPIEVCSLNSEQPAQLQSDRGTEFNANDYLSVRLQTFQPESLAYQIDFYDGRFNETRIEGHFGQTRILPVVNSSEEKPDNRDYVRKVPILRPHDNKPIGYVSIDVLIITSLQAPIMSPQRSMTVASSRYWRKGRRTLHVGHRGLGANKQQSSTFSITKPATPLENTIASFKAAQQAGVDMIEFDVQLTKDNVPLIFHDFQVPIMVAAPSQTTTGGMNETIRVAIKDLDYQQLANLRKVVHHHGRQDDGRSDVLESDERSNNFFPTLTEVFQQLDRHLGFNIEVKYAMQYRRGDFELSNYFERNRMVDQILDCIISNADKRFIVLSSFDPDCCLMLHKKQNRYPVFFLSQGNDTNSEWPQYNDVRTWTVDMSVRFAASERFVGISLPAKEVLNNPSCVQMAKQAGLVLFSWEVSRDVRDVVDKLTELGVDGMICDEVDANESKEADAGCLFMYEEQQDVEIMRELYRKRIRQRFESLEAVLAKTEQSAPALPDTARQRGHPPNPRQ